MNPTPGLSLYDASALQRWKTATLPADPDAALKEEAAAASSRAQQLHEQINLGGADQVAAVRNQAQQLKAEFLAEARTPERVSEKHLKDKQLAFRAALAGLMVGALEGALACAGQELCAPIPIADLDQWGGKELGSEVFTQPAAKVAKDQSETPLPPNDANTLASLNRGLTGGVFRSTVMSYRTQAEGLQTSFEVGHSRVVQALTAASRPLSKPLSGEALPRWTVLKYCISDGNLASSVTGSVAPFAQTKINPDMRVVVQHGGFGNAARFEVGDGIRVVEQLPDTDMARAANLQEFLEFGVSNYPSQGYIVSILGHGTGPWGMLPDEGHGTEMQVADFGQALQNASAKLGRKFDVVVSDNCLGGNADMAKQVAPAAHYWLSSEDLIGGDRVILSSKKLDKLSQLMDQGTLSREEVVDTLGQFKGPEQRGVFNLEHYPAFETAFARFSESVRNSPLPDQQIKEAGGRAVSAFLSSAADSAAEQDSAEIKMETPYAALKDAGSLLTRFAKLEDAAVQKAATEALEALKQMTVSNYTPEDIGKNLPNLAGLSVLMPLPSTEGPADFHYEASQFAQDTGWLSTIQQRFPEDKTPPP